MDDKKLVSITLTETQAFDLYDLLTESDPYPGTAEQKERVVAIADQVSHEFGYSDWVNHYINIPAEVQQ